MAPSAGLLSLLAHYATPSFLMEVAGEHLESLEVEISACELAMKESVKNDQAKDSDEGKVPSNRHDSSSGMNKKLERETQQKTRRKRREESHPKKNAEDELKRLHIGRDVMIQDVSSPSQPLPSSSS
ncbi:hypothetical protein MMC07_001218 [Pseudocyphellaria aurata]|nr:hypothetical protein [Pseudocyphellaria aurata]